MQGKSYTKDELFILKLHQEAEKQEEIEHPFDRYEIGQLAGIQERGVNAICNLLIRANFIKKVDETLIYITPQGIRLVNDIKQSHK